MIDYKQYDGLDSGCISMDENERKNKYRG